MELDRVVYYRIKIIIVYLFCMNKENLNLFPTVFEIAT